MLTTELDSEPLARFEEGDKITISARESEMEVIEKDTAPLGNFKLIAKNSHGRYRLRGHSDGSISLRVSGEIKETDVEVNRVD